MTKWLVPLLLGLGLTSCVGEPTAPVGAPYLAVVVLVDAPDEVTTRGPYRFRVRELSGTIRRDTTFFATPRDTVILSVEPATYVVEIDEVPAACGVRQGGIQYIEVPPRTNTSLARFLLTCRNALTLTVLSDGNQVDSGYVFTVTRPGVPARTGVLASSDTILLDNVTPGTYDVALRHVAENCTVLNSGGDAVQVTIPPAGGATHHFRVTCSEPARRPRIAEFRSTYDRGAVGIMLRVADPDRDVERFAWDITDCSRRSVLPDGWRRRGGFAGWENVTNRDTAIVISGFDIPLSDAQLVGRCQAVYVGDERGNISEILEVPLVPRTAAKAPGVVRFNATYVGTASLRVDLEVFDPDDDFVGAFLAYNLRDGVVILPPDGAPDRVILQPAGIIGSTFPDLPFNIGFGQWSDYLTVTVYLVDRAGNVTRIEDPNLFQ
ncbi:MAG: hypothetical protein IPK85_26915 [Gemmatimonadetes bacterium]|nr:hypothetical protein [Gemmatimonadota bacterium]